MNARNIHIRSGGTTFPRYWRLPSTGGYDFPITVHQFVLGEHRGPSLCRGKRHVFHPDITYQLPQSKLCLLPDSGEELGQETSEATSQPCSCIGTVFRGPTLSCSWFLLLLSDCHQGSRLNTSPVAFHLQGSSSLSTTGTCA